MKKALMYLVRLLSYSVFFFTINIAFYIVIILVMPSFSSVIKNLFQLNLEVLLNKPQLIKWWGIVFFIGHVIVISLVLFVNSKKNVKIEQAIIIDNKK